MAKHVGAENWNGHSHQSIYETAQAFKTGNPAMTAEQFHKKATDLHDEATVVGQQIQQLVGEDWRGKAAQAMQDKYNKFFHNVDDYVTRMHAFADTLPPLGHSMDAAKSSIQPPEVNESTIAIGQTIGGAPLAAAAMAQKMEDEQHAREQMVSLFSQPVVSAGNGNDMDGPADSGGTGGSAISGGANNSGSGGTPGGPGGLDGKLQDLSKIGNTNPAFDRGAGDGQGAGQGQGGGGQGSGGGAPGGGSGSGAGGGPGSGLGSGSDPRGSGAYSPLGSTNAAGFSPTATGTGTGTGAGVGPPGGGLGAGSMPPGSGASGGANAGGLGARGAMGGMGVGMGPMGAAHGARGKGEDEDEKPIPPILINVDNGNELFGDMPKASPGVIGDWSENEEAEKKAREAEIRRYKSMGWDVKFE